MRYVATPLLGEPPHAVTSSAASDRNAYVEYDGAVVRDRPTEVLVCPLAVGRAVGLAEESDHGPPPRDGVTYELPQREILGLAADPLETVVRETDATHACPVPGVARLSAGVAIAARLRSVVVRDVPSPLAVGSLVASTLEAVARARFGGVGRRGGDPVVRRVGDVAVLA